jgi:hypothetical protein
VCVCGLYVIVSYFFEVHWFWLFYSFQEPSARSVKEFSSRSPSDSFYVSRAG